jgi:hypothetical protein
VGSLEFQLREDSSSFFLFFGDEQENAMQVLDMGLNCIQEFFVSLPGIQNGVEDGEPALVNTQKSFSPHQADRSDHPVVLLQYIGRVLI